MMSRTNINQITQFESIQLCYWMLVKQFHPLDSLEMLLVNFTLDWSTDNM